MLNTRWWPHVAMALQTLLVAPGYTFGKWAALGIPSVALLQLRIGGTALILLLALLLFRPQSFRTFRPSRADWAILPALVLISPLANQLLFVIGLRYAAPSTSALLYSLIPLLVLLIGVLVLRTERFTQNKLLGIGLALVGVVLVIQTSGPQAPGDNPLLGVVLTFGSVLCWAWYIVFNRRFVQRYPPLEFITLLMVLGTVIFLPVGLPALLDLDWAAIEGRSWFGLFYLTAFNSAASFLLMASALQRLQASQASVYTNLQPGLAALFSAAWGLELLTPVTAVGMALAFVGVYLLNRRTPLMRRPQLAFHRSKGH
jgi:drug/metabolite transporter (DMT)-like permease